MYNCDNYLDFPDRCILLGFLSSLRQSSAISGVINNQGDNQCDRCYFPQKCKHGQKVQQKKSTVYSNILKRIKNIFHLCIYKNSNLIHQFEKTQPFDRDPYD